MPPHRTKVHHRRQRRYKPYERVPRAVGSSLALSSPCLPPVPVASTPTPMQVVEEALPTGSAQMEKIYQILRSRLEAVREQERTAELEWLPVSPSRPPFTWNSQQPFTHANADTDDVKRAFPNAELGGQDKHEGNESADDKNNPAEPLFHLFLSVSTSTSCS
ncbi:hypothetical protein B0H17DRAFT_1138219 [Mycena rosella]|uniref:Uncharacterized protein n=1 Tax=Mycena rosella TaxID=1033263 RepID=A0AAD7D6T4_MYCRO|nr:hypothetical protein B0H17DRAFT_1138219 [Mycena rosella]